MSRAGSFGSRVLIVDSDQELRQALRSALTRAGYRAQAVGTGAEAVHEATKTRYNLILLDLVLPDANGQAVLAQLLAMHQVVIVLTQVSDAATRAACLEHGARDYLTKPFSPRELLARVRLRLEPFTADWAGSGTRLGHPATAATARSGMHDLLVQPGLQLDLNRLTADCGHGAVQLTRTEFLLLVLLVKHAGQAITAERLRAQVWELGSQSQSNVVCVCVRRLRAKLGRQIIETIPGKGYRLGAGSCRTP